MSTADHALEKFAQLIQQGVNRHFAWVAGNIYQTLFCNDSLILTHIEEKISLSMSDSHLGNSL